MFSQTVEYALRAIVHLAQHPSRPQKTSEIAEKTKVPVAYLAKVLQGLHHAGILRTQRGVGGGVGLAIPSDELTVLQVVNAVEPFQRIKSCPLELKSHGKRLCSLHRKLDESLRRTEEALGSTTVADLLNDPNPSRALCDGA